MSEITPASNPKPANNSSPKTATGVDLAPVSIGPSKTLWCIELGVYCSVFCAATLAVFPFFLKEFYWPITWLSFLLLLAFVVRERWRIQTLTPVIISVQKQVWRLKNADGEFTLVPFDEILLWSGVIILPVRETISGRKHRIVALSDSMKTEDWRRLRVWLRTGLRNNS